MALPCYMDTQTSGWTDHQSASLMVVWLFVFLKLPCDLLGCDLPLNLQDMHGVVIGCCWGEFGHSEKSYLKYQFNSVEISSVSLSGTLICVTIVGTGSLWW